MTEFRVNKKARANVSSQMALLHLRWQQIRWELLQQASPVASANDNPQRVPSKKSYATA